MESKGKDILESIVYIIFVILVIFASVYGSIYIRLIPLLFVLGIVGNAVFKRQMLTTILGFVVSLSINYLKTPTDIMYVLFISSIMCFNIVMGEAFGKCLQDFITRIKEGESIKDKKGLRTICLLLLTIGTTLLLHSITTGSIGSYQECRKNLSSYLEENYINADKFKEINVNYYAYKKPRYVFYLSNTDIKEIYKFTVYVNEEDMIIDGYKEAVQNNKITQVSNALANSIINSEDSSKYDDFDIKVKTASDDKLCVEICKNVKLIENNTVDEFAKKVALYLDDIKNSGVYDKIEQVNLLLKSKDKPDTSIVSIIYMKEYNLAVEEKSDISYKYILKALKMEYDY